ncbi:acetyl-CoA carboxylase, carboxyltransferase subunit beta [Roseofilum sp. BLCC_M91]|uniref:Acetyl-coenzyme A carboxylase carboxyl transferase subunit beta n=1 Tax=Roseofilum halophilum BLCC-M91 TaxID=3022259 RepID=A0ABT7BNR7_9CYAN|nr:acetyl-CoA carboxylase, carboxyltransferase subunit beta [Roseofilum halophilum]MDJ1180823.1 acetyl-CoA carboxylase, carboxyltransferase subunit beta [Roseofilum halophilum BLCC-M91]
MSLFDWFANRQKTSPISPERQEREIADGLWTKCPMCGVLTYTKDLQGNQMVCLECEHHFRVDSNERIAQLMDGKTWTPLDEDLRPDDPLKFKDRKRYSDRLKEYQGKTHLNDAVQTGLGQLDGLPVALAVMDFGFMGGSMGSVVGEKITRLLEKATLEGIPAIVICASGGARMQEGMLSLMQMAKISGALERHREAGLLYIPVLTHPTTGGVIASFAMLGDLILAEPKATIGFAGRRVIEQTLREKLPDDFQTSEYLLQHGFVDLIVPRTQLKKTLAQLVRLHGREEETPKPVDKVQHNGDAPSYPLPPDPTLNTHHLAVEN